MAGELLLAASIAATGILTTLATPAPAIILALAALTNHNTS